MNLVILTGRLTAAPSARIPKPGEAQPQHTYASFRLAVQRAKDAADFINCTCFDSTANFATQYLDKGTKIAVIGSLNVSSYELQDGTKKTETKVIVRSIEFLESKKTDAVVKPQPPKSPLATKPVPNRSPIPTNRPVVPDYEPDDELPF